MGEKVFDILNKTVFILLTLLCIFPFYYLFINTISNNDLSARGYVLFLPLGLHFSNYMQVLRLNELPNAAFVSIARTAAGTLLTVVGSSLLGWLFSQGQMWGRKFWYRFMVVTMYFNAGIIPWFIIMMDLRLTNNFLAYLLPVIVQPFYVVLVKTYVESVPSSMQESAEIDGARYLTVYIKIILPLIKPILATIAVFAAVNQWNSFSDTLFLMTDSRYYTLQFILYRYLNAASTLASLLRNSSGSAISTDVMHMQTAASVRMTVSFLIAMPILLIYPYFQRYFVKGIMIGALKG